MSPIASDEEDARKGAAWLARAAALAFCVLLAAGMLLPVPLDLSSIAPSATTIVNNPTI